MNGAISFHCFVKFFLKGELLDILAAIAGG
jgi:hypothetical protein